MLDEKLPVRRSTCASRLNESGRLTKLYDQVILNDLDNLLCYLTIPFLQLFINHSYLHLARSNFSCIFLTTCNISYCSIFAWAFIPQCGMSGIATKLPDLVCSRNKMMKTN